MPIPDLDDIRRPALQLLAARDGLTRIRDVFELLAPTFQLTDEDLKQSLPSGTQLTWHNRVNWACYDLYRAGALDRPTKGNYGINDLGRQILDGGEPRLTRSYLAKISSKFASFLEGSKIRRGTGSKSDQDAEVSSMTPEEAIDSAVESLEATLNADLLDQLHRIDPFRFESVVLDLLLKMGYGGSREEAGQVTKKSNDEGIDGVINQDPLGLDVVYIQAKRWQNVIGRKEIQSFVGALAGQQANKGVFITTSSFANTAVDFARNISQKIILIDGNRLADLMIEHGIGVSTMRTIEIKRLDTDYFEEN